MNRWLAALLLLVAALIGIYLLNPFKTATWDPRARLLGVTTYRIASMAMAPTLLSGDLILVRTSAYMSETPQRGDIAVFRYPENKKFTFIFRVAAVSGDHVEMKEGALYINHQPVNKSYLMPATSEAVRPNLPFEFSVPEGHIFVLGDNRNNARDGRYWGPLPITDVIGKATYIWASSNPERVGSIQ